MKTQLLLDLTVNNYKLISVNKAYFFYDPKRKNKYQPYVADNKLKSNIQAQIIEQYNKKPLKIDYVKVDINASKDSDIDNKSKTLFDACEKYLFKNDRDIVKILLRRSQFNRIVAKNKNKKIIINFTPNTLDNSVNYHWKSNRVKLSKIAKKFKEDLKLLARFYKKNKKYISTKRIIVIINTRLKSTQDLDNIFKLLLDSFSGIIYNDDKQIDFIYATKKIDNNKENNLRIRILELL